MGKKSRQKTTNEPSAFAKPFVSGAANALNSAYETAQPRLNEIGNDLYSRLPGIADMAFGPNPGLDAARGYATDVLGGKYLDAGNPYTQGIIDQTNNSVTDRVQSAFSKAGRTGSGVNQMVLGKSLAEAENGLRYQDYDRERQAMAQAASMMPGLDVARYQGIAPYLALSAGAAEIPMSGARNYASGVGGLLGQYGSQTTTQSGGNVLGSLLGAGLSGWASGGFKI